MSEGGGQQIFLSVIKREKESRRVGFKRRSSSGTVLKH